MHAEAELSRLSGGRGENSLLYLNLDMQRSLACLLSSLLLCHTSHLWFQATCIRIDQVMRHTDYIYLITDWAPRARRQH